MTEEHNSVVNHPPKKTQAKPEIPPAVQERWQRLLNLMASIIGVPAGAIMKSDPPQIEIFLTSEGEENTFRKGDRLWE